MDERRYYNSESLSNVVSWYEKHYGLTTEELLDLHRAGQKVEGLSGFDRHTWLSFARECQRMSDEDVGDRFRRSLVTA